MTYSRRTSRSRRGVSGPNSDPFNDANMLESAYTSSEDDAASVPSRRTTDSLPVSQIPNTYPALGPSTRPDEQQPGTSSTSEPSDNRGRRGSSSQRQGSASSHAPPPVSLQTRQPRSLATRHPRALTVRPVSRSLERSPNHWSAASSSDGYTSSEQENPLRALPSNQSDSASIVSRTLAAPDSDVDNPFMTPRKGSVSDEKPTQPESNRIAAGADNYRPSTVSSQVTPRAPGRHARRHSSLIDPSSLSARPSRHSPTKQSLEERRGHQRNFSRPFNGSASESGSISEQDDKITELRHIRWDENVDPMFNPSFAFGDARRGSESLQPQAQREAQRDAQDQIRGLYKEQGFDRRKSSCVLVNRRKSTYTIEEEKVVRAVGKKRLKWTKWAFLVFFICANGGCIAVSWLLPKYWYVFAPVILLGNVLNTLMVLNLTRYWLWREFKKLFRLTKPPVQPTPTTIAMVLACYCENYDELMATLESLHEQENVEQHKKMFLVIVDGQVKGKGMAKSTDRILVEDIFKPEKEEWFPVGYESWDGVINGLYACSGDWRGVPYVCLVKKRNLGKRDGLILVRTLLYKYQMRHENPETSMGDDFFRWFCDFSETLGIERYEWLVGVDADTTFNKQCIYELHYKCIQDERLIGCSGLIQVGFRTGNWNIWNLYQNAEYIRAQCLRRMHQAKGTGKVSCLPGACQIIKICEETCGDKILIDTFGHIPDPKDHMVHQVRALAGEDRNYICIIFKHYPKAITTMALNAIAFTDPPNGAMVFLSQRKRWTLSTSANDMLIVSKNAMNWFERLCSLADVMTWVVPIFVAQTFALFVRACVRADTPVFILSFATVTIIPIIYGLVVTFWGCKTSRERLQYLAGFGMVVLFGQLITPTVISYALWHMDDFSWGKTREVEDDGTGASKPAHSD